MVSDVFSMSDLCGNMILRLPWDFQDIERDIGGDCPGQVGGCAGVHPHVIRLDIYDDIGVGVWVNMDPALPGGWKVTPTVFLPGDVRLWNS